MRYDITWYKFKYKQKNLTRLAEKIGFIIGEDLFKLKDNEFYFIIPFQKEENFLAFALASYNQINYYKSIKDKITKKTPEYIVLTDTNNIIEEIIKNDDWSIPKIDSEMKWNVPLLLDDIG